MMIRASAVSYLTLVATSLLVVYSPHSSLLLLPVASASPALDEASCHSDGTCTVQNGGGGDVVGAPADDKEDNKNKNDEKNCFDEDDRCGGWARDGECKINPSYMLQSCKLSCGVCGDAMQNPSNYLGDDAEDPNCRDNHKDCEMWAGREECELNPSWMLPNCQISCGICLPKGRDYDTGKEQHFSKPEPEKDDLVRAAIEKSNRYLRDVIWGNDQYRSVRTRCIHTDHMCSYWAAIGECENRNEWMMTNCPLACLSCDKLDVQNRCPLDQNGPNAFGPGDLHRMFERLTTDEAYAKHSPQILSRPAEYGPPPEGSSMLEGPWVITLDEFITQEECNELIRLGGVEGYERSTDVGEMMIDGTFGVKESQNRTSQNAWCRKECYAHPTSKRVMERIAEATGIPEPNQEYLQMLRYEEGQFYRTHHDYIEYERLRQQGPRMLTMFLYLNDVEEGGGTNFPDLNLTVHPKRGRALLWPSVINDDPTKKDYRTEHQALEVIKGVKYAANAWIHVRDFKASNTRNCS